MEKATKKNAVYNVHTAFYNSNEQDRVLRLHSRKNGIKLSQLIRAIVCEWLLKKTITEPQLVSQILEDAKRDWEIQKLKNISNPNEAVLYDEFLIKIRHSFKRLPRDIIEFLMQKLRDETDGQK